MIIGLWRVMFVFLQKIDVPTNDFECNCWICPQLQNLCLHSYQIIVFLNSFLRALEKKLTVAL